MCNLVPLALHRLHTFLATCSGSGGDGDVVSSLPDGEFVWPSGVMFDRLRIADRHVQALIAVRSRACEPGSDDALSKRLTNLLAALEPGVHAALTNTPLDLDNDAAPSPLSSPTMSMFGATPFPAGAMTPTPVAAPGGGGGGGGGDRGGGGVPLVPRVAPNAKKKLVFVFGMRLALARIAALLAKPKESESV